MTLSFRSLVLSERNKVICLCKDLYMNVNGGFVYISQTWKQSMPTNGWMAKQIMMNPILWTITQQLIRMNY